MFKNLLLEFSVKNSHANRSMRTGVAVKKIHCPLWSNPPDALQQSFQNSLVEFRLYGIMTVLTADTNNKMDQAIAVEKGD